jgi:carbamoyltransferase
VKILGIVSETHDAGLALIADGIPALVIEEERLNREKHTIDFPALALAEVFGERHGHRLEEIAAITTPWNLHRLRWELVKAIAGGLPSSLDLIKTEASPTQHRDIVFLNHYLRKGLKKRFGSRLPEIVNVSHHDAHAAIFFVSPFEEASVLVMDGYGDDAATSVFTGAGNRLKRHWHGRFWDSLGIVYTLVTYHLGFRPLEEGTVMALAAIGGDSLVPRMRDVVHLADDGTFHLNMEYFAFDRHGIIKPFSAKFIEMFGPPRQREEPITDWHRDLARALQTVAEETMIHVARGISRHSSSRNLCLTGGVALNCVANARLLEETDFQRIWVPPCASDTGAPLGSALWHYHQTLGRPRSFELSHAYYGSAFEADEVRRALEAYGMASEQIGENDLVERVARDLAAGKIVGWFQGRYEMGPRALGNRSILASPLKAEIRDIINRRIKYREPFRPFSPAVLEERAHEFFELGQPDPIMTLAPRDRPEKESLIPAAVHVDCTASVQTVSRSSNPRYYDVIEAFGRLTGVPIVINTSFNKQEPIVARPEEAISCFLRTDMDVLVLGDFYTTDRPAAAMERAREQFRVIEANLYGGE